jgi:hypothetical protein
VVGGVEEGRLRKRRKRLRSRQRPATQPASQPGFMLGQRGNRGGSREQQAEDGEEKKPPQHEGQWVDGGGNGGTDNHRSITTTHGLPMACPWPARAAAVRAHAARRFAFLFRRPDWRQARPANAVCTSASVRSVHGAIFAILQAQTASSAARFVRSVEIEIGRWRVELQAAVSMPGALESAGSESRQC